MIYASIVTTAYAVLIAFALGTALWAGIYTIRAAAHGALRLFQWYTGSRS